MATPAKTSKENQKAAALAIEIDGAKVHQALTAISKAMKEGGDAEVSQATATLDLVRLGPATRRANENIDRNTVADGWAADLDTRRVGLFADDPDCPLVVQQFADDGTSSIAWSNYGNNVKSTSKGVVELWNHEIDGLPAMVDVESDYQFELDGTPIVHESGPKKGEPRAQSFRAIQKSVKLARRAENESDEVRAMREAKEAFREQLQDYAAVVIDEQDIGLIIAATGTIGTLQSDFERELEIMAELIADAAKSKVADEKKLAASDAEKIAADVEAISDSAAQTG